MKEVVRQGFQEFLKKNVCAACLLGVFMCTLALEVLDGSFEFENCDIASKGRWRWLLPFVGCILQCFGEFVVIGLFAVRKSTPAMVLDGQL